MSDPEFAQVMAEAVDAARYRYRRTMLGGRRVDAATVTLAGAPDGKSWVRGFDQSREETAVWGSVSSINAAVEIDRRQDGEYEIVGIDWLPTVATHGDAARSVTVPIGGEIAPTTVPALSFAPGRMEASELGGLFVHIREFDYDGGFWRGGYFDPGAAFDKMAYDVDLTAYVPTTSGFCGWVRGYFDPSDGSPPTDANLHFVADTPVFASSVDELDEAAIGDIPIPTGTYPVGAVALAYGQTTLVGGRFASARYFLGKKEAEISQIMTDGRGFPITEGRGFLMLGAR